MCGLCTERTPGGFGGVSRACEHLVLCRADTETVRFHTGVSFSSMWTSYSQSARDGELVLFSDSDTNGSSKVTNRHHCIMHCQDHSSHLRQRTISVETCRIVYVDGADSGRIA